MIPHRTCEQRKVVVRGRTNCGRGCSFSFFVVMVSAMTIQKKTCCVKQHAVIDTVWGLLKGICGMSTVGRNYSLTRDTLQTLVIALGAGLGIWGAINLMEGYGNDNPGAKSQGMKQLMAGGGVALIGTTLVPLLSGLF